MFSVFLAAIFVAAGIALFGAIVFFRLALRIQPWREFFFSIAGLNFVSAIYVVGDGISYSASLPELALQSILLRAIAALAMIMIGIRILDLYLRRRTGTGSWLAYGILAIDLVIVVAAPDVWLWQAPVDAQVAGIGHNYLRVAPRGSMYFIAATASLPSFYLIASLWRHRVGVPRAKYLGVAFALYYCTGMFDFAGSIGLHRMPHVIAFGFLATTFALNAVLADRFVDGLEQQQRVSRIREEFIANVSHELRTPLGVVRGYLEMFELGILGPVTDKQKRALRAAILSLDQERTIVEELLLTTQLEEGVLELKIEPITLHPMLVRICTALEAAHRAKNIQFSVVGLESFQIFADTRLMDRMLTNLVSNAFKYSYPGGQVEARFHVLGDDGYRIEVQDNGEGIPEGMRERVFERFARNRPAGGDDRSGIGLGLSIVRQVSEYHGGTVFFRDAPSGGTVAIVELPLVASNRRPTSEKYKVAPSG